MQTKKHIFSEIHKFLQLFLTRCFGSKILNDFYTQFDKFESNRLTSIAALCLSLPTPKNYWIYRKLIGSSHGIYDLYFSSEYFISFLLYVFFHPFSAMPGYNQSVRLAFHFPRLLFGCCVSTINVPSLT